MGFGVLIDIIGSMVIGGIVLMMIGNMNNEIVENNFNRNEDLRSSFNLTYTAKVLEDELKNVGYTADYLSKARRDSLILIADTSRIKFLYDYDKNQTFDTIYYYLGTTQEMNYTSNPNDRYIYKRINSKNPVRVASGVTRFRFNYFYDDGKSMTAPVPAASRDSIGGFQVSLNVASAEKRIDKYSKDPYPQEYWRLTTVTARNLTKR